MSGVASARLPSVITVPSELVLDPAFDIEANPQHRYYEWNLSEMTGAQDGCKMIPLDSFVKSREISPSRVLTYGSLTGYRVGFACAVRRTMFVVNGQAEGPLIEANNGWSHLWFILV